MTPEQFQGHVVDRLGALHERIDGVALAVSPAQLQAAVSAGFRDLQLQDAVASGIRDAAMDPALWASIMAAVRTQAKAEAGGWLFGGIKALLNRLAWFAVIAGGIYMIGGWSALVSLMKSPTVGQ